MVFAEPPQTLRNNWVLPHRSWRPRHPKARKNSSNPGSFKKLWANHTISFSSVFSGAEQNPVFFLTTAAGEKNPLRRGSLHTKKRGPPHGGSYQSLPPRRGRNVSSLPHKKLLSLRFPHKKIYLATSSPTSVCRRGHTPSFRGCSARQSLPSPPHTLLSAPTPPASYPPSTAHPPFLHFPPATPNVSYPSPQQPLPPVSPQPAKGSFYFI